MSVGNAFEAFIVGGLAATSIIYAFQTRTMYPKWMLRSLDHPWVLLIVLVITVLAFQRMPHVAAMVAFIVISMWMDMILFAQRPMFDTKEQQKEQPPVVEQVPDVWPFEGAFSSNSVDPNPSSFGQPLGAIAIQEPLYPVFKGTKLLPPGPAPFQL